MKDLTEEWFLKEVYEQLLNRVDEGDHACLSETAWKERCCIEESIGEENPHIIQMIESLEAHEKCCCLESFRFGLQIGLDLQSKAREL